MTVTEVPVVFFVLFAIAVVAAFGVFGCSYLLTRRLGLTWMRQGSKKSPLPGLFQESEWRLSKDQNAVLRRALWGGNAHIEAQGVFRLVWATRLLYATLAGTVVGGLLTLAGAAK